MTLKVWLFGRPDLARRVRVALTILVFGLAVGLGLAKGVQPVKALTGPPGRDDISFYVRVVDRVRAGQPYYPVVADEIRALHGPVKPFLTVRPPLLAIGLAALPSAVFAVWILLALAAATFTAWCWRLGLTRLAPLPAIFTFAMLSSGYACTLMGQAYLMHEMWAGLLIALALALYRPERWGLSLGLALLAALERELAAPFLLVMAAFALVERRPKEMLAWLAACLAFAIALWRHALRVQATFLPSDTTSPGWVGGNGWPFVLHAASWNGFTQAWPSLITVLFPLALLGLVWTRDPAVRRAAVTVFGFAAGLLMFGRPENYYWGMMIAPLWPLGLITAPRMLADLKRDLFPVSPSRAPAAAGAFAPTAFPD